MTADAGTPLWWKLDGELCADAVNRTCESLERTQAQRRIRVRRNIEMYEGRRLAGLNPAAYYTESDLTSDDYDKFRVNLARSLVHTAIAKIAAKQKPKAQFMVTDGDWSLKRKAKKLERFVEAHMIARQANHHDAWAVNLLAFRDCCVGDLGAVKYEANLIKRRVDIRRVFSWELIVDPHEARYGEPLSLFHGYSYDRFKLCERFPKHEQAIMSAPAVTGEVDSTDWHGTGADVSRQVRVREAWRLPLSDETPGRHAIVVGKTDLTDGEEWTRDFFPFEFMVWEPWMMGIYGTSIVDNVFHLVDEANAQMQRMSDAMRLCSNPLIDAEEGSYNEEALASNKVGAVLFRRKGAPPANIVAPSALNPSATRWWEILEDQAFKIPGISMMQATGQKEPGVTADVALRTVDNIATERFAVQWENYERSVAIGAARQIVACVREIADEYPDFSAKWPGSGFLQEISWKDVDLDEDMYSVQVAAVSGLVNSPADRLQLATELKRDQIIGKDAYLRIIQSKDIDSELDATNEWSQLTEKYIESWLDATKEKEQDGSFLYYPPIKFAPLPDLIVQVGRAYAKAQLAGAPDYNLGFFIRFMGQCDAIIQQMAAAQSEMEAAAKGKAQGGIVQGQMNGPVPGPGGPPAPAPPPPQGPPPGGMLQ